MKLSDAQKRVLKLLGHGWQTQPGAGSSILVNGQRVCNIDTMMTLFRLGLAENDADGCWSVTATGKTAALELVL